MSLILKHLKIVKTEKYVYLLNKTHACKFQNFYPIKEVKEKEKSLSQFWKITT